jgi:hypothetical protein
VTEVCRNYGRKESSWFTWRVEELRKTHEGGFTLIELMAVGMVEIPKNRIERRLDTVGLRCAEAEFRKRSNLKTRQRHRFPLSPRQFHSSSPIHRDEDLEANRRVFCTLSG